MPADAVSATHAVLVCREGGGRVDLSTGACRDRHGVEGKRLSAMQLQTLRALVERRLSDAGPLTWTELGLPSKEALRKRKRDLNARLAAATGTRGAVTGGPASGLTLAAAFDLERPAAPVVHEDLQVVAALRPWVQALGERGAQLAAVVAWVPAGASLGAVGLQLLAELLGMELSDGEARPLADAARAWSAAVRDGLREDPRGQAAAAVALPSLCAWCPLTDEERGGLALALMLDPPSPLDRLPDLLARSGHGEVVLDVMRGAALGRPELGDAADAVARAFGEAAIRAGVPLAAEGLGALEALGLVAAPDRDGRLRRLANAGSALGALLLGFVHLARDPDGLSPGRTALVHAGQLADANSDLPACCAALLVALDLAHAERAPTEREQALLVAAERHVRATLEPVGGGLWALAQGLLAAATLAMGDRAARRRVLRQLRPSTDRHPALSGLLAARALSAHSGGASPDLPPGLPALWTATHALIQRADPVHATREEALEALRQAAGRAQPDLVSALLLGELLAPTQVALGRLLPPDRQRSAGLLQVALDGLQGFDGASGHAAALLGDLQLDDPAHRMTGLALLQRSAAAGHPTGLLLLGRRLLRGRGLRQSPRSGLAMLDAAAAAGGSVAACEAAEARALAQATAEGDRALGLLVAQMGTGDVLASLQCRGLLFYHHALLSPGDLSIGGDQLEELTAGVLRIRCNAERHLAELDPAHPLRPALEVLAEPSLTHVPTARARAWLAHHRRAGAPWAVMLSSVPSTR